MNDQQQQQQHQQQQRQQRWLVYITGASRGFGRAVALSFCRDHRSRRTTRTTSRCCTTTTVAQKEEEERRNGRGSGTRPAAAAARYIRFVLIARSREGLEETKRRIILETDAVGTDAWTTAHADVSIYASDWGDLDTLDTRLGTILNETTATTTTKTSRTTSSTSTTENDGDQRHRPLSPSDYDRIILVNNAGSLGYVGPSTSKLSSSNNTLASMRSSIDFNVTSCLWTSTRFLQHFTASAETPALAETTPQATTSCRTTLTIVNVSSLVAIRPFPTMATYSAGKAARDAYHTSISKEVQGQLDRKDNNNNESIQIRVLNYAPGPLETDMSNELRSSDGLDASLKPQYQKQLVNPQDSADVLVQDLILVDGSFENGSHIDYYDMI